jgi:hypothetical protein
VNRRHAVEIFVDGAHQHLLPKALDRLGRLPLLLEPLRHRDGIEIPTACTLVPQRQQPFREAHFVSEGETAHPGERLREMKRRWEHPRPQP